MARVTDPLQQGILRHLLARLVNVDIIWLFGRPCWDTLGDLRWLQGHFTGRVFRLFQRTLLYHPCCAAMGWLTVQARRDWVSCLSQTAAYLLGRAEINFSDADLNDLLPRRSNLRLPRVGEVAFLQNGRGESVALSPEMTDFLRASGFEDQFDQLQGHRRGSAIQSMNAAERNGTGHTVGEYQCNNRSCGRTHIVRLNAACGLCNKGLLNLLSTEGGNKFQGLEYGYAQDCDDCVGLVGMSCTCCCGDERRHAGRFNRGVDPTNYRASRPPKSLLVYVTDENGVIQYPGSFKTAGKLVVDMYPALTRMSETVAGQDFIRANYPWALDNRRNEFIFRDKGEIAKSVANEMKTNPNRAIVIEGKHYKMRPWDYARGER